MKKSSSMTARVVSLLAFSLVVLVIVEAASACPFRWRRQRTVQTAAAAPLPPAAPVDLLDDIRSASRTSMEKVRSAAGSGTFEHYVKWQDEKEPRLMTKAKVDMYVDGGKYHLHFN